MATTIPKTQRAAVIVKLGGLVEVQNDWPVVQPEDLAPGQILVKMEASGVCHSDLHIKSGEWPTRPTPFVSGHEGIGTIVAFSKGTAETGDVKVGSRVGVKWVLTSCGRCEYCRTGRDPVCDNVLYGGQLVNGAFSEYMVAWANQVVPIPEGIPSDECVSILCAGYTVYGGLKNGNFKAGQWVVIPGAGGGLGHLAIQYAVAMGIRVIAIDTGDEKKKACLSLGAEKWIDFAESKDVVQDVIAAAGGPGPHGALIATPSITAYDQAIEYLRKYGTLVAIGVPTPPLKLNVTWGTVVWKALRIQGVVVGNLQDAVEALDFVARGKVHAHTQSRKLDEINQIYEEMSANKLIGRAVIHYDH